MRYAIYIPSIVLPKHAAYGGGIFIENGDYREIRVEMLKEMVIFVG